MLLNFNHSAHHLPSAILHIISPHHFATSSAEMAATDSDVSLQEVDQNLTALVSTEPEHVNGMTESNPEVLMDETEKVPVAAPAFFRLPAELRLQIYQLVLTRKFCLSWPKSTQASPTPTRPPSKHSVALLLVNRKIHFETRQLPFQLGTFVVGDPYQDCFVHRKASFIDYIEDILQSLQDGQKSEIRHLELSVTVAELQELYFIELRKMISRYRQDANEVEGRMVWAYFDLFVRVCGQSSALKGRVHWIASCLRTMASVQKFTVAGTEITLDREEVLHLVPPRPLRKAGR